MKDIKYAHIAKLSALPGSGVISYIGISLSNSLHYPVTQHTGDIFYDIMLNNTIRLKWAVNRACL